MGNGEMHYYIQGFAMVLSPGRVVDVDIYFVYNGRAPRIRLVECFAKDRTFLGHVYIENITLEVRRAMVAYIKQHTKKWHRLHKGDDFLSRT